MANPAPPPAGVSLTTPPPVRKVSTRALWLTGIVSVGLLVFLVLGFFHGQQKAGTPAVDLTPYGLNSTAADFVAKLHPGGRQAQPATPPPAAPPPPPGEQTLANQSPGAPPPMTAAEQRRLLAYQAEQEALATPVADFVAWTPPAPPQNSSSASPAPVADANANSSSAVPDWLTRLLASGALPPQANGAAAPGNAAAKGSADDEPLSVHRRAAAPYMLLAPTWIHATLDQKAASELPGNLVAQVDQHVYDKDGHVLIPQGSKLIGSTDGQVRYGQDRMLQVWKRCVFPDGSSLSLDNTAGLSLDGTTGVAGHVNNHTGRLIRDAAIVTAFAAGIAVTQRNNTSLLSSQSFGSTIGSQVGASLGQLGTEVTRRNLAAAPTIEVRPGSEIRLLLIRDLIFDGPYQPMEAAAAR